MKVGLFGGSFDPVHSGHVAPVVEVLQRLSLDRVIYLPTAQPPHKPGRQLAPAMLRYSMVELAILSFENLRVSDFELRSASPTYTWDSVCHFRDRYPDWDLHLLIGADSFAEIHQWHRWKDLFEAARVVVMARPSLPPPSRELSPSAEVRSLVDRVGVEFIANQTYEASSSEIRRRMIGGEELPAGWLAEPVVELLCKYRPYR